MKTGNNNKYIYILMSSKSARFKQSITNQNQGGGSKKQGLMPSVGTGTLSNWNGLGRAYGTPKSREMLICINQLGSVNPRVYQSKYCGGGGANKPYISDSCEYYLEPDSNQYNCSTDSSQCKYDVSILLDKSGSMGTGAGSNFVKVKTFIKNIHKKLLNTYGTSDLPSDTTTTPPNPPYVDIRHRISLATFSSSAEANMSYETYIRYVVNPGETNTNSYPTTIGRFDAIIDKISGGGGTNTGSGINQLLKLNSLKNLNIENLASATVPGTTPPPALDHVGINITINNQNPNNFTAASPITFEDRGQLNVNLIPPYLGNTLHPTGWRGKNTIMILLSDGGVNTTYLPNYYAAIQKVNNFDV
jgi:hypothetical protein